MKPGAQDQFERREASTEKLIAQKPAPLGRQIVRMRSGHLKHNKRARERNQAVASGQTEANKKGKQMLPFFKFI
ncbi:MAG: hypothetical protein DHS20C07_05670 [Methyloligella sp.]|nr:MAG: hypothetical protein DHS20C07_05670 [Methyloligella sp.]